MFHNYLVLHGLLVFLLVRAIKSAVTLRLDRILVRAQGVVF